jgi:hypothetical protein
MMAAISGRIHRAARVRTTAAEAQPTRDECGDDGEKNERATRYRKHDLYLRYQTKLSFRKTGRKR